MDTNELNNLQKLYEDVEWKLNNYRNYIDETSKGAYDDYLKMLNEADSCLSDLRGHQGGHPQFIHDKIGRAKALLYRLQSEIDHDYNQVVGLGL